MPAPTTQQAVAVLGIRHHGPGSARSVLAALEELAPDLVLIEGPAELDALVPLAGHPDLVPPVAGLVYAVDEPRRATFYPLATFSPEWVALRWAVAQGIEVRFADLAATHQLAPSDEEPAEEPRDRPDAIGQLARAAGYDDPERWWEDAVEHRRDSALDRFTLLREAMEPVRADAGTDPENDRREAAMRKAVRTALKAGKERIAFVCGAYHAPALDPSGFPPASRDNALLAGLPKTKVAATWVPWTARRLAVSSGYGAGVTSPGWYQHLFLSADDDVVPGWLVRVARALRDEQLEAAPASVVEAVRLAEALAAVRARPSVGLTELTDATRAVLTDGSDVPLALIDRALIIGDALGRVPDETPMVPLAADLARLQRSLRLKASATSTIVQLDLRRDAGRARSVLFHRLAVLGVDWATPVGTGRSTGTFKEAWELEWVPELAVSVIEASLYGTTVESAAGAAVGERAAAAPDLALLGDLVEQCLLAELPEALDSVIRTLAERTARQHDALALLRSVEPLARTCRYGNVRDVDTSTVRQVLETVVVRAALGLPAACQSLDDDAALQMREGVEGAARGIALLDDPELQHPWERALQAVAVANVHGGVAGRINRMLLDAGLLQRQEAADRLSRRLSTGADATAGAAWLDGFLAGEALILLHDDALLSVIDGWVAEVGEEIFEDLLPLLRRTFARYQPPERRQLGRHLRELGTGIARREETGDVDLSAARPALATMARMLGLEMTP